MEGKSVRLLSGQAPEAFAELLAYDCRLMNVASRKGGATDLRDWLIESDEWTSPQAAVLSPEATVQLRRPSLPRAITIKRLWRQGALRWGS